MYNQPLISVGKLISIIIVLCLLPFVAFGEIGEELNEITVQGRERELALNLIPKEENGRKVFAVHENVRQFIENEKVGLLDESGNVLLPAGYDEIDPFCYEGIMIIRKDNLFGAIRLEDGLILEPKYYFVSYFQEGMAFVMADNGRYGYINNDFELVIEPQYRSACRFNNGIAPVFELNTWRFIDKNGKYISDVLCKEDLYRTEWDYVISSETDSKDVNYPFGVEEEMIIIKEIDDLYGFMNVKGEVIVQPMYEEVKEFSCGYAAVKENKKWHYIDKNGKTSFKGEWDEAFSFSEGYALVVNGDTDFYVIDTMGKIAVDGPKLGYKRMLYFVSEGLIPVNPIDNDYYGEGKWTYSDMEGNLLFEPKYYSAVFFQEGLAKVSVFDGSGGENSGYINTKGEVVIPTTLKYTYNFYEGMVPAVIDKEIYDGGHYGLINTRGEWVVLPLWDYIDFQSDGLVQAALDFEEGEHFEYHFTLNHRGEVVKVIHNDFLYDYLEPIIKKDVSSNYPFIFDERYTEIDIIIGNAIYSDFEGIYLSGPIPISTGIPNVDTFSQEEAMEIAKEEVLKQDITMLDKVDNCPQSINYMTLSNIAESYKVDGWVVNYFLSSDYGDVHTVIIEGETGNIILSVRGGKSVNTSWYSEDLSYGVALGSLNYRFPIELKAACLIAFGIPGGDYGFHHVLPTEEDISQIEALDIAKKAVEERIGVTKEEIDSYITDFMFLTGNSYSSKLRKEDTIWLVFFYHPEADEWGRLQSVCDVTILSKNSEVVGFSRQD